jgi:glyoxylase-like metal-dependent hydrolase (beta-lactamase superfamily II)
LVRVINTHHHADHTGGNYAFVGTVPVLAHVNAGPRVLGQVERYKERLKGVPAQVGRSDKPAAQRVLKDLSALVDDPGRLDEARFGPTELIEQETEIKVGGRRLSLHHYGAGHTDNDLVVHLPELNVVHTGDLLFNGRHPVMDVGAGANSTGWIASLRRVIELCDDRTVVVPGHGAVTNVEGVRTQIRYFEAAQQAMRNALLAGAARETAQEAEIAGFASLGERGKARVLAAVYDELKDHE